MIGTKLLALLETIARWYLIIPLIVVILRWKSHDLIRRRVAWIIFFNIAFNIITYEMAMMKINNLFVFYLASPVFIWINYLVYQPVIGKYKLWKIIRLSIIIFSIFVVIDMFFIENYRTKSPDNIYPPQEIILLFMVYYYLYIFSKEARKDFSLLWISLGIGISAILLLIILIYLPTLSYEENTLGYYIYAGLGSFSDILSYSFIAYGLYIANPKLID